MSSQDCILHTGATCDGYGVKKHKRKLVRAHRLSYCNANNFELSDIRDKVVMHTCDNRLCINPDHLVLGTQKENCQDKVNKGRQARGETCGNSKLKTADILKIRELFENGYSFKAIASLYSVSAMCISRIHSGKTWGHVWAA